MKISEKLIRVGLVTMVILSLFLTWKNWTNSGNKELPSKNVAGKNTAVLKQAKDVFLPVKLIYHDGEEKHFYTNKESLISNMTKEVLGLRLRKITTYSQKDSKKYFDSQMKTNSFELVFSSPLPLAYFFHVNGKFADRNLDETVMIQRVVVSLNEDRIYFLNDANRHVYSTDFSGDTATISRLLKEKENRFLEVAHEDAELPFFYQFIEPITLKKYSYILATQSYTTFTQAFFKNNQELFSTDEDKDSSDINLQNYENETFTVRSRTGEVYFSGRFNMKEEVEDNNVFGNTFAYVERIGSSMGTLRYFEGSEKAVVYRSYVEGFPIFSDNTRGRVELNVSNQNIQIRTNQETIQVPIPSDEEVTVQNTAEVVKELEEAGISISEIKGLQIGYSWTSNQETRQVVDLVPEWYVRYRDSWESVANIKQLVKQEMGED